MAPRGEIENRDRDEGIGDVPEDLGIERGEIFQQVRLRGTVPSDMGNNAARRTAAQAAPLGTPSLDFDVRSIYDSRPVNGRDFNLWFQATPDETGLVMRAFRRCFVVPTGYVAVVRSFTVLYLPATPLSTNYDGLANLMFDEGTFDSMDVDVGPGAGATTLAQLAGIVWVSDRPVNVFGVADQGQFVGLDLSIVGAPVITDGTQLQVGFYGQFLQKTNVPAQFQIANKAGSKGPPVTLPPSATPNLPRPRRQRVPYPDVPIVKR